jgi:hypothetical protein
MTIVIENNGDVKKDGRKIAKLRNGGAVCDIRRHRNGFLYHGGMKVSISEELLESLADTVVIQITDMDRGDVYSCTVHDFRHWSEPVQFGSYEPQRCIEVSRMNHTRSGKKRVNELVHIEHDPIQPVPTIQQLGMFG